MDFHLSDLRMRGATAGLLLLILLYLGAACDASRSARTARNGDAKKEAGTEEEETVNAGDTLDQSAEGMPLDSLKGMGEEPGIAEAEAGAVKKDLRDKYEVLLLLPFLTNRFDHIGRLNNISRWSLNFYGGVQMALDELRKTDLGLHLTVMDSEGSREKVRYLLGNRAWEDSTHLIIGPYRRVNIREAAEFGKKEGVNVISPYSAASNLTDENPHFIQVRPSLKTHCVSLANHALENYNSEKIVLVGQDRALERKSFEHFQEAYFTSVGARDTNRLEEMLIDDSSESLANMELDSFMLERDTTIFLVSAWSDADESFVYSFLRQLELARQPEQEVVVYGTPVWQDFDRVDLDYLEKMKVRISSHIYLDPSDPEIRKFRRAYYERYGNLPPEEAFLGYDVMNYFGRMLLEHGTQFQMYLEGEETDCLHTRFEFERVVEPPTTTGEENPPIEQFENKYVHILRFQNYQFKRVK